MVKKRDRRNTKPSVTVGPLDLKTRLSSLFFPAILVGLQLGLISVWNVYRGNQAEFDHGLLDLLPFYLPAAIVLTAVFWIIPAALPERTHIRTVSFLTMVGTLLYVQGNLLVWDYGVFDGGEVQWARHQGKGWLELALWVGALAWAVTRPGLLYRFSRLICLLLIGLQVGYLTVASIGGEEGFWHREGSFADMPPAEIYEYSRNRNVVHVLLDAFQTDVFEELVAEEDLTGKLDGFVLFRENLGVAAHTSFAIPAIFAAEVFAGNESPSAYYGRCIGELGFQNLLFDAGYRVNLLPRLGMDKGKYSYHFRVPNTFGGSRGFRQRQAAGQLLDVGLFRQLPHFAKRWIHNGGQWRLSGVISTPPAHRSTHQRAFLSDYISRIEPVLEEPSYSFIHIMSPHPPYGTMADGGPSPDPLPLTRENYKNEARYSLLVFMDLLEKLEKLGVYDDALIILQGDHGGDFSPVVEGVAVALPVVRAPTLLAMKAPGRTGPLTTSGVLSSISDLPVTVTDVLEIENSYQGLSLLEGPRDTARTRSFFQYLSHDRDNPVLRRFEVTGSIFDPNSWSEPGETEMAKEIAAYTWGDVMEFGMEGNADPFTGQGWAAPLSNGQWTDGNMAHLHFQIEAPGEDVDFLLAMRPFLVPGQLDRQRVHIVVNDEDLTTFEITEPQAKLYKFTIPGEVLEASEVAMTFVLPDATVPRDLGVSSDERQLGVSVISICLFPQSMAGELMERTAASQPKGTIPGK